MSTLADGLSNIVKVCFCLEDGFDNIEPPPDKCRLKDLSRCSLVIIDSNDLKYLEKIKEYVCEDKTIWVTDLKNAPAAAFYKIIAPFSKKSSENILPGLDYFIVPQFDGTRKNINRVETIGVSFGSLDETNNLFFLLYKLDKLNLLDKYKYNILLGDGYKFKPFIDEYFNARIPDNIKFYQSNFRKIYDFLSLNDLLISCCNNTTFEALYLGLPVVSIVQNNLQYENAHYLETEFAMPNLGFYPSDDEINAIFKGNFMSDICSYSEKAKKIIDGDAVNRIGEIIRRKLQC